MINIFSTRIGEEEIEAIKNVAKTNWLGYGSESKQFERELSEFYHVPYVLFLDNCTSGLFISLKLLNIKEGDEVIIPSIHFIGTATSVVSCGAIPVFVDCDPYTLNIIPEEIQRKRTKKTKAVLLLHYGGHSCDFEKIEIPSKDLYIIEDSANSVASIYKDKKCGTLGEIGCISFDSMKIMTTCDGGAILLNDKNLYERALSLRQYGMSLNSLSGFDSKKQKEKWWEIDLNEISGRYISNDVLAAIGRVQLKKLSSFIERRKMIWEYYQENLSNINDLRLPPEPLENTSSSYYLYWIQTKKRDELAYYLLDKDIYCTFRYFPLHLVKKFNYHRSLPNSEYISNYTLNIPLHQYLSDEEIEYIVKCIKNFYRRNLK